MSNKRKQFSITDIGKRSKKQQDSDVLLQKVTDLTQHLKNGSIHINESALTRDEKKAVLILQYGSQAIEDVVSTFEKIPSQWTERVRKYCLKNSEYLSEHEIVHYAQEITYGMKKCTRDLDFIGPPVGHCLECHGNLTTHNPPSNVKLMTLTGQLLHKQKLTLKCQTCKLNYAFDKYGSKSKGYQFYPRHPRDCILATDGVLIEREVVNLQWSFAQHGWVSFEGFSESWHDAFNMDKTSEIDRRTWAHAFWWAEIENELREEGLIEFKFHSDNDRERCMVIVDEKRKQSVYPHPEADCTPDCTARGCGKLFVTDGIWKLQFAHCMFHVKNEVEGMTVNLPPVCTNQLKPGQAFCNFHCKEIKKYNNEVPTKLHDFLKYADGDGEHQNDKEGETLGNNGHVQSSSLQAISDADHTYAKSTSVLEDFGGQVFLKEFPQAVDGLTAIQDTATSKCHKDLGERKTLRMMSRGHQFVVRGGGHIDMWTPLYKSESKGQVFLFLISWLYLILKNLPKEKWKTIWLAYDNMCQLLKSKVTSTRLPLPIPFDKMWSSINKVIDAWHLKNHVDVLCHTDLHPDNMLEMYPELKGTRNTQAAEQTFVWLGRFKKIVCSMPKIHHLFYLHRIIKRRNRYISKCYKNGKKPLLPKIRNRKTQ